jgi:uncharacterized membrane protein
MTPKSGVIWWTVFLVVSALSWLIPPIQSPDENSHMARAYLISRGHFFLDTLPLELGDANSARQPATAPPICCSQGGMVNRSLVQFFDAHLELARDPQRRLTPTEEKMLGELQWSSSEQAYSLSGAGYYFPAVYLPHAIGLAAGRQMGLSVSHTYQLSRVMTLGTCVVLLYVALGLWRISTLTFALLLLPMSLFQFGSPTIDGLTAALTVVIMSGYCKLWAGAVKNGDRLLPMWICCIFLLVSTRTHMLPLLLLPMYLAWRHSSRNFMVWGLALWVASLAWIFFAMHSTVDTRMIRNISTGQLMWFYLSSPSEFIRIVWASLSDPQLFTFYEQSFVGILGWLNAMLPLGLYPALWTGLGVCAVYTVQATSIRRDWPFFASLASLSVASIALIFFAMLTTWTPFPAVVASGVQGRYFLLPILVLGYALQGPTTELSRTSRTGAWWTLALFSILSIYGLTGTLLGRYH